MHGLKLIICFIFQRIDDTQVILQMVRLYSKRLIIGENSLNLHLRLMFADKVEKCEF